MNDETINTEPTELDKHFRAVEKKIDTYLSPEQPPDVLIIKAHLICEYYINQILLVKELCNSKEIRDLTFFNKMQKAFKLENAQEKFIYDKIDALNKLRNKTGHELEYKLSESDVDELGYINGKEYIFKKYDFESIEKALHYLLVDTVVDVSFFLMRLVKKEKEAIKNRVKRIPLSIT